MITTHVAAIVMTVWLTTQIKEVFIMFQPFRRRMTCPRGTEGFDGRQQKKKNEQSALHQRPRRPTVTLLSQIGERANRVLAEQSVDCQLMMCSFCSDW